MVTKKILVVGSLVEDLISQTIRFPSSGETVVGAGFSKAPGGKGANQAVQAARLGVAVDFYGMTGDDVFSHELVSAVRSAGVDTSKISRRDHSSSGASGVSIETIDGIKCNRIIMNPGANFDITIEDVRFLEKSIDDYACLILQFEIPLEVNEFLAKLAHEHGVIVVVNPAPSHSMSDAFLKCVDYLTPNEHEATDLTWIKIKNLGKKADDNDITKSASFLLQKGVKNVLITLGGAGSVLINKKERIVNPAIPDVKVVDPTAAGDSFIGAFASGLVQGLSHKDALHFGSYVAALTVQKLGAMPSLPTLAEVEAYIAKSHDEEFAKRIKSVFPQMKNEAEMFFDFKDCVAKETEKTLKGMDYSSYEKAVCLIEHAEENGNRVHITGIGKPSHVAEYLASLLSSTGTPTYYLHGTEAVHGSCGQLVPGDVVIAISNSGETAELKATLIAVKKNGCKVIGVSGCPDSWLAHNADAFLLAHIDQEGGPLNKAPRSSIISEILVLQGLSIILQAKKKISPAQYVMWHPGGKLGESIAFPNKH